MLKQKLYRQMLVLGSLKALKPDPKHHKIAVQQKYAGIDLNVTMRANLLSPGYKSNQGSVFAPRLSHIFFRHSEPGKKASLRKNHCVLQRFGDLIDLIKHCCCHIETRRGALRRTQDLGNFQ